LPNTAVVSFFHQRCAMSSGARAPQASPLGHAAQGAARAPLRAAVKVALVPQATAPPALPCRTPRSSRLQHSAARISKSSAALQTRLRGRRLQNAAHSIIGAPWPFGHAGVEVVCHSSAITSRRAMPLAAAGLDTIYVYSYVASNSLPNGLSSAESNLRGFSSSCSFMPIL
jgi:hypothetical protein